MPSAPRFTELNRAYTDRFGFPFILAVKGRGKAEILHNFEARLGNDRETELAAACARGRGDRAAAASRHAAGLSPMATLLIKNAGILVTMDDRRREIEGGDLFARDGVIVEIGARAGASGGHDRRRGGLRRHAGARQHASPSVPDADPRGARRQDALLFGWLKALYPIWARMGPEEIFVSAQLGLAELALSGCTMSADHLYLFPNGARLDDSHRGRAHDRPALPRHARLDEHRRKRGRPAAGQRWSRPRRPSSTTASASSTAFTTPPMARCSASASRPARRSRSAAT